MFGKDFYCVLEDLICMQQNHQSHQMLDGNIQIILQRKHLERSFMTLFQLVFYVYLVFQLIFPFIELSQLFSFYYQNCQAKLTQKYFSNSKYAILVSFCRSFIVFIYNRLLPEIIRKFTSDEKHPSESQNHYSFTLKLSLTQFLNTGLTTLVMLRLFEEQVDSMQKKSTTDAHSQEIYDVFFIYIITVFFNPIYQFLNPSFFYYKYWQRKNTKSKQLYNEMTQLELNKIFEGDNLCSGWLYSAPIKVVLLTVFYAPLIPIVLFISLFGLFMEFWVEKYVMLKRSKQPPVMGVDICLGLSKYFKFIPIVYTFGNFYMFYLQDRSITIYYWVGLGFRYLLQNLFLYSISLLNLIIPTNYLVRKKFYQFQTTSEINNRNENLFKCSKIDSFGKVDEYNQACPYIQDKQILKQTYSEYIFLIEIYYQRRHSPKKLKVIDFNFTKGNLFDINRRRKTTNKGVEMIQSLTQSRDLNSVENDIYESLLRHQSQEKDPNFMPSQYEQESQEFYSRVNDDHEDSRNEFLKPYLGRKDTTTHNSKQTSKISYSNNKTVNIIETSVSIELDESIGHLKGFQKKK